MNNNINTPIIGNERVVRFLQRLVKLDVKQNLSGSYVFTGPSYVGKTALVGFFVKSLLCQQQTIDSEPCGKCSSCLQVDNGTYSDIYNVEVAEGKRDISIEQIKQLISKLSFSSFLNSYKIGIINQADRLNDKSANALLKTLEEPNSKVLIFLIANNIDNLPQTIISRSQVLKFNPVKVDMIHDYLLKKHDIKRSMAKNLAHLSAGRPILAEKLLEDTGKLEDNFKIAEVFLDSFEQDLNSRLNSLSKIIGTKFVGQSAVESAKDIIDIWQNIQRDLWLAKYGEMDLIHYSNFSMKISNLKDKVRKESLSNSQKLLEQAKMYISANVNPKLTLENLIINI